MSTLEGASKYLNNLLLARGLLQNGKRIDFAHPGNEDQDTVMTMTDIINLIHDLVLRRDRDSEQRENMAASIGNLRAIESQQNLEIKHLQESSQQRRSEIITAQAQERVVRTSLKKLEKQIKELKEQNLKMKSALDQVRAKCISDVRKRDMEIEKLKGHLIGVQRNKKDSSGMKINAFDWHLAGTGRERTGRQDVNSADWSLEKESNDFLAALVNETSVENVTLRQIVDNTLTTLKEMTGVDDAQGVEKDDAIGIPGRYRRTGQTDLNTLASVTLLAEQVTELLHHCRTILRDPSFVSIEEVRVRDEEIAKLRLGWEGMADRWKEAVTMMSQWKHRMMLEGKTSDLTELSDLSFGRSIAVRPDGQPVLGKDNELSLIPEESNFELEDSISESTEEANQLESDLKLEPEPVLKRLTSSPARRGIRLPTSTEPLGESTGNSRPRFAKFNRSPQDRSLISDDIKEPLPGQHKVVELTVAQKLAAVEREAIEALENGQQVLRKRKKTLDRGSSRKSGRRRSTLSPEELASMMEIS